MTRDNGRILILCHGNYMRSPVAEVALVAALGRHGAGKLAEQVASAGFRIWSRHASKAMREEVTRRDPALGRMLEQHVPRLVTHEMLREAELVLYMDGGNRRRLDAMLQQRLIDTLNPPPAPVVRCLAEFISRERIQDPAFNRDLIDPVVTQIMAACEELACRIVKSDNVIKGDL